MDPLLLDGLFSYLHFIFVFLMVGTLIAELFVLRLAASAPVLKLLARIDIFFGASAGFVLLAGFGRLYFGAKGADYYWANHSFWGKLIVFVIVGVISIWPTMKFIQWGSALKKDASFLPPEATYKGVRRAVMIETMLIALIPLFAVLMARGIG